MIPTPIQPGPQRVNLEQLANAIKFEEAQLKIHENALEAWNKRGDAERAYTRHVYVNTIPVSMQQAGPWLENYMKWHKAYYDSEAQIRTLQIAQFKSHLAIQTAILEEAKNPKLMTPGLLT